MPFLNHFPIQQHFEFIFGSFVCRDTTKYSATCKYINRFIFPGFFFLLFVNLFEATCFIKKTEFSLFSAWIFHFFSRFIKNVLKPQKIFWSVCFSFTFSELRVKHHKNLICLKKCRNLFGFQTTLCPSVFKNSYQFTDC